MTAEETLLEVLRKRKQLDQGAAGVTWQEMKREWLADVEQLLGQLRGYLRRAEEEGLVRVSPYTLRIAERPEDPYDAPALRVETPGGGAVDIAPRARCTLGSSGRVDLLAGPARAMLVRFGPGHWVFMRLTLPSNDWERVELSETTFCQILVELLS